MGIWRMAAPMGALALVLGGCGGTAAEGAGTDGAERQVTRDQFVVDADGRPAGGALITARDTARGLAVTVYADEDGAWTPPRLPDGSWSFEARSALAEALPRAAHVAGEDPPAQLRLSTPSDLPSPRASSFLAQLPDGDRKRRLIVDCGGCHTFDALRMRKDGRDRTAAEWTSAITLMVQSYGQGSGFPIISGAWDAVADGRWLAESLTGAPWPTDPPWPAATRAGNAGATLTEFDVPEPADLAHDVAVDGRGRVLVTGMFTHRMYVLDPSDASWETVSIPVGNANPRAVDVDAQGRWWVLLGAAGGVARYEPASGEWTSWRFGMYPHSIALDSRGGVWVNGHFTHAPELIARLDPGSGDVARVEVTSTPAPSESTIPYGLRVDRNDVIWATQLRGNRLIRHDPATGSTETFTMPSSNSGPRRPDVGPDGTIWIPEFGANKLARFDPSSRTFTEYDFPAPDAAPYVVRVDQTRGTVWIGTGHGDVMASFDPASERFTLYPLPTRGALVRHLDVDEATGDVWAAYSASPGIGGKVLRIQP